MRVIPFFVKQPLVTDLVRLVAIEEKSIPVGANPFNHDSVSMGTPVDGKMVMMTSSRLKGEWKDMRLDVPESGQRFRLVPVPLDPQYHDLVEVFGADNQKATGLAYVTSCDPQGAILHRAVWGDAFKTFPVHTVGGQFNTPLYYFVNGVGLKVTTVLASDDKCSLTKRLCDEYFMEDSAARALIDEVSRGLYITQECHEQLVKLGIQP